MRTQVFAHRGYVGIKSEIGWFDLECKARRAADIIESWSGHELSEGEAMWRDHFWNPLIEMAARS
jgi:hypothetical protein